MSAAAHEQGTSGEPDFKLAVVPEAAINTDQERVVAFFVESLAITALAGQFGEDARILLPSQIVVRCGGETLTVKEDGQERTEVLCPGANLAVDLVTQQVLRLSAGDEGEATRKADADHASNTPAYTSLIGQEPLAYFAAQLNATVNQHIDDAH